MKNTTEWTVITTELFNNWITEQDESTRESVLSSLNILRSFGHHLARPYVDTLKGSQYPNMKELRIQHQGKPLRAFFAFDPLRQAIVLCAGDKSNDKKFYEKMIRIADNEFTDYLQELEK
ncbi:type II toxin-antitoxin system RelE/ParE family toxin [Testudinibacter sp. TR-2022]|uniref:type II toxin-antitoxin system RelE/ParE family toxin n=1 Tax=Testudinibacter sp. TR-2022 TaxID=2585029 RepID=UPI001119F040|nr:type II toxin-antitoxin system RelE/ParE family toxin [Testudinibacter sp. TR-2022]TNH06645.1 type II toxin-antitoxin system RelE/ParE family toxin [Pasteurellaceae bacterium Phil11]TNH25519.1 type II toxin-antitoxin system RelE/ParE family toxin [Testudinibacter sp. TR-2022]TNH25704.1 type II toxin-antitoxin system RelE/ParE family toxin [Testudinibacter sp. TR-2022]